MRIDLRESLLAKIIAVFLIVILLATGVLSFVGIVAYYSYGIGREASFFESSECTGMLASADRMAYQAYYGEDYGLERYYGVNYSYEIYAITEEAKVRARGDVLLETETGAENSDLASATVVDRDTAGVWNDADYEELLDAHDSSIRGELLISTRGEVLVAASHPCIIEDEVVVGYVSADLRPGDEFYKAGQAWRLVHNANVDGVLPWVFAASVLGFFVALVFLLCAAGHRAGYEGISPNHQDQIPLDIYLAAMTLMGFVVISLIIEASYNFPGSYHDGVFYLLGFAAMAILLVLLCLATLMTLTTRLKLGKWWRNSVIYIVCSRVVRVLRRIGRIVRETVRILPYTWRTALSAAALLVVQFLLCTFMWNDRHMPGVWFIILLLLDIAIIAAAIFFSWQMSRLFKEGEALARGDLETTVTTDRMVWDFKRHAENLNAIGEGMNRAVEQRLRSERLKTELITNVSHDIKTPLTSIVNYVDLLKKEELGETAGEYVEVLDRQSRRLKKLTEDLVEASKASTGNIAVDLRPTVVNELIHQAVGEYAERLTAGQLEVVVNTMQGNVIAKADGRLLWRVLDNLLSNVSKYAQSGTRVYVDLKEQEEQVSLTVKNISRDALSIDGDELMERFVRGDQSRNTEGSGLGLNIARSLVELMKGSFHITVDGDLFKAEIVLPKAEKAPEV